MEPSTPSSGGVIPRSRLTNLVVFTDLEPEGEKILKSAKLAHVNDSEGFIVTMEDETYSFSYTKGESDIKITRIPELCSARVKEFFTGSINLAVTEDGRLYSWCIKFLPNNDRTKQLGRLVSPRGEEIESAGRPGLVTGSLTGQKVVQVAIPGEEVGNYCRVVALTVGGEMHQWGGRAGGVPETISKGNVEGKEVISVVSSADQILALTADGKATHVRSEQSTSDEVYWLRVQDPERSVVWTRVATIPHLPIIQDIATCWARDVLVVELKNKSRFRCRLVKQEFSIEPSLTNSIDEAVTDISEVTNRTIGASRAGEAKPRTLGGDIANLWRTKENADVTFSVERKTITAHKFILTCRSEYFAKMFSNEWREGNGFKIVIKNTKHQ
ncbi:BTB/POZ domain-containing protein 8 [Folsomia candida]|uniref:BTB/POZ domain-containing protein 8 n=1 Tax=Folsomia candida TaxID=158441 RepID=A0A226DC52_FOLCA|nr:BTB/POZ domain-containing protein 8 [Folsomia candida]